MPRVGAQAPTASIEPAVAVAVSGGRDSIALLHATLRAAAPLKLRVCALHVHHGLMPQADEWLARCRRQCRRWRAQGHRLEWFSDRVSTKPAAGESVEAWGRRERYKALRKMALQAGAHLILLAHHRRDQAETVLLQLLRGAGAAGLAAMPAEVQREALTWARPWLDMPREAIDAYVRRWHLSHADDPSNIDERFARGRLRSGLWTALQAGFPELEGSLVHAARRAQEADAALRELAQADLLDSSKAARAATDTTPAPDQRVAIDAARLRLLSPARQANLLRHWLNEVSARGVPDSLIDRLLVEISASSRALRWPAPGATVTLYRGALRWEASTSSDARPMVADDSATASATPDTLDLSRPGDHRVAGWAGVFRVQTTSNAGLPRASLKACSVRTRAGGERFQLHPAGIPRSLKKQYQAAGVPAWRRGGPLLYGAGELLYVPGLGIDARCWAPAGVAQLSIEWRPDPADSFAKPQLSSRSE